MKISTDRDGHNFLLKVMLSDREICIVRNNEAPTEKLPSLSLQSGSSELVFVDSKQKQYCFDLSSLLRDEWIHFSIRVSDRYVVQADGLLSRTSDPQASQQGFQQGHAEGVRFQPFFLPECKSDPAQLIGKGMFFRGFHFPGIITPGNVSSMCLCDVCHKSFRVQSVHAGFGNDEYFYCSGGPHTLAVSLYSDNAPPDLKSVGPDELKAYEDRLPTCEKCGGRFGYFNSFGCPYCNRPYIDCEKYPQERKAEYYGNYLYGDTIQEWK